MLHVDTLNKGIRHVKLSGLSNSVRCVGVLSRRWVSISSETSPPFSSRGSTISSCNVLANTHLCHSHLEPPRDVCWSRMVLAGLIDWSLVRSCACVGVCTPSPCCRQDITVWVGGACCEVTPPHTRTAPARGNLRSAAESPCFGGWKEDQTWRGIAKSWWRSLGEGGRLQQRDWWANQELESSCWTHTLAVYLVTSDCMEHGRSLWDWKGKPMCRGIKNAFFLKASRGQLHWFQRENKDPCFSLDLSPQFAVSFSLWL